ncbi:MAG TPA: hypothetical protein VF242_14570 [Nitrososphaeraceae archaeon]
MSFPYDDVLLFVLIDSSNSGVVIKGESLVSDDVSFFSYAKVIPDELIDNIEVVRVVSKIKMK